MGGDAPSAKLLGRCFHALDHDRIEFHDNTGRCAVASAGAAALGIGVCVLGAPELVVGAVIVAGLVVVGFALHEALDAYALDMGRPEVGPVSETAPIPWNPSSERRPEPEPKAPDLPPVGPTGIAERERQRRCEPIPEPHAGTDAVHNRCADQFPPNRYPGRDVLVDGVSFDALQVGVRVLWEIKTHQFDTYPDFIRKQEIAKEMKQLRKQRAAAAACGYGYVIGVSTQAHKDALLEVGPSFDVVVTGCKR